MRSESAATAPNVISASVGRNGVNKPDEVKAVQILLNLAGANIKEDSNCGHGTISAIESYERNWSQHPDGRVDPGGIAWKRLIEGKLKVKREVYSMLPQVCGNGYYPYSPMNRQYGTTDTIAAIVRIAQKFSAVNAGLEIGIGDMSFVHGEVMHPHKSHRNGRCVDVRPLRSDGKMLPVTINDDEYDGKRTKSLVEIIRADHNFHSILFNDSNIPGVVHWQGHNNHLHVTMKT